jgi:beta-mannosidase
MALNWCFQEPWPTAANNSLINWPNILKPAYYSVADACRPVSASIRAPKFLWDARDEFSCELFMLNDTYEALKAGRIKLSLVYDNKKIQVLEWDFAGSGEFENSKGPVARVKLPAMKNNLFVIKVEAENNPKYNSEYVFLYKSAN